jgi:NAD(P)-dependent dehydrogenase (short-subunit alcohol dehydrogenase family)
MSLTKAVVVVVGGEDALGAALSRCYAANGRHVLGATKIEAFASTVPHL